VTTHAADGDAERTFASTFHLAHLRENRIVGIERRGIGIDTERDRVAERYSPIVTWPVLGS
jgi:hypothetical protein